MTTVALLTGVLLLLARILKLGFLAAVAHQRDVAAVYLPSVIDRPWLGEISFPDACALAAVARHKHKYSKNIS